MLTRSLKRVALWINLQQGIDRAQIQVTLRVPHQCALHMARQIKLDIRRQSERRCPSGRSVAVSQAGVNDLISPSILLVTASSQRVAA